MSNPTMSNVDLGRRCCIQSHESDRLRCITHSDSWIGDEWDTREIPSHLPDHLASGSDAPLVPLPDSSFSLALQPLPEAMVTAFNAIIAGLAPLQACTVESKPQKRVFVRCAVCEINLLICRRWMITSPLLARRRRLGVMRVIKTRTSVVQCAAYDSSQLVLLL